MLLWLITMCLEQNAKSEAGTEAAIHKEDGIPKGMPENTHSRATKNRGEDFEIPSRTRRIQRDKGVRGVRILEESHWTAVGLTLRRKDEGRSASSSSPVREPEWDHWREECVPLQLEVRGTESWLVPGNVWPACGSRVGGWAREEKKAPEVRVLSSTRVGGWVWGRN